MCGITGFVHNDASRIVDERILHNMTDILSRRGPDGEGFYIDKGVALGHRRLAIIDIETGDQPMFSTDGNMVLICNGEIYNYIELREELIKRGHKFITKSDIEVMLASYKEWGEECVNHFNGMWAFVLYDREKKKIFCSRDRMGEKPFFYTIYDNTFIFGSEIKAIFRYGVNKEPELLSVNCYLSLTFIPGIDTFFKNIKKLAPGHNLVLRDGEVRTYEYWDVEFPDDSDARFDIERIISEFKELFYDLIKIRMRSDVPYGAFLSGGLDSGTVTSVMTEYSNRPVKTFTIGFDRENYDESKFANMVAKRYNSDHHLHIVRPKDGMDLFRKISWHCDEPFGDSSALPTYIV